MKYRSLIVRKHGGPQVLEVAENELRPPRKGEVRIRVLAASVSRPDVSMRRGEALYSGTFLGQKLPFTPGYSVIGEVDAVGEGVMCLSSCQDHPSHQKTVPRRCASF
ncbi:MAG: alcohol dehydrogenase catalytic domain-containing protein [Chloroflexota bacterium]